MSEPMEVTTETTPTPNAAELRGAANKRQHILTGTKLAEQALYVPEWGVTVLVREMKAAQRSAVLQSSNMVGGGRDLVKFYPDIVIASTYDQDDRTPIFELTDRDALNETGGKAMERIAQIATVLSGLTEESLKEDEKNLPTPQVMSA